jgi:hypothetical protein
MRKKLAPVWERKFLRGERIMFKKNTWVVGLLIALAIMFVGCVDPIVEEGGEEIELVNLQELIKDAPDGLISDWGKSIFGGTPFMKCGNLNISIITEGGVKKLKLDGMTQTWGEGIDIRHAATADGNTGVGYKAGDTIAIKGKVTPANDGLLVNASGGGYAKVDNLGADFDSSVTLTQDNVTAIKSGNPQTIRLHYDSGAARIGTIILEQIIITGKRAAGEGPEPPPDFNIPGQGDYTIPAATAPDINVDLNTAVIGMLTPLENFPVGKIDADKLEVKFDFGTQTIFIPFTDAAKATIVNAAKNGFTFDVTVAGTQGGHLRWCFGADRAGSWNQTGWGGNGGIGGTGDNAGSFGVVKNLVPSGFDLDGIVMQARPDGNASAIATPYTVTITSIKITPKAPTNDVSSVTINIIPTAGLPAPSSVSGTGWTGAVTWSPALAANGTFLTSTYYSAIIAISPTANYYIRGDLVANINAGTVSGFYNPETKNIITESFDQTEATISLLPEGSLWTLAELIEDNPGLTIGTWGYTNGPFYNNGGAITVDETNKTIDVTSDPDNWRSFSIILGEIDPRLDPMAYKIKMEVIGKVLELSSLTDAAERKMKLGGSENPYTDVVYSAGNLAVNDTFTLSETIPATFLFGGDNVSVRVCSNGDPANVAYIKKFQITSIVITNEGAR